MKKLAIFSLVFVVGILAGLAIGVRVIKTETVTTTSYSALPGSIWAKAGVPVAKIAEASASSDLMKKLARKGYEVKENSPYKYIWTIKKK